MPTNGRVAHVSLMGELAAEQFTDGTERCVARDMVWLWSAPDGNRERTLLFGERFCVLEVRQEFAFGFVPYNGYVGYLRAQALDDLPAPTHVVSARLTSSLDQPDFKRFTDLAELSLGAQLHVDDVGGRFARYATPSGARYVPALHLRPVGLPETDPVAVAERLLGTPYVWGGNSARGIDCSGLVQAGLRACGQTCPGDSDLQERALGVTMSPGTPYQRGDLLFWKGHVAWVADPVTLLHANAHSMSVAFEPLQSAIDRIAKSDGPVIRHARIEPQGSPP
ncbi:cell wall-associated hydrolase, invasion-associated protein [Puniceibacterium sp. IMCC21224]|nr:cell wall-associated hydrolase, invasion-associated protein [Puniceibacterium sp. IMCC21224]